MSGSQLWYPHPPNFINAYALLHGINPLKAELNPSCHQLALLGAHHILQVSRVRVNKAINQKLVENEHFVYLTKPSTSP
jgi:hypothetical protein